MHEGRAINWFLMIWEFRYKCGGCAGQKEYPEARKITDSTAGT